MEEWERRSYRKVRGRGGRAARGRAKGGNTEGGPFRDTESQRRTHQTHGATHHPAGAALAQRPPGAGTAFHPAHPGKTGQIPADSAILASACKGSREGRRQADGGGGGVKGDMVAPALGRGGDGHRWRKYRPELWVPSQVPAWD